MHHTILRPDTRTIRRRSTCPLPRSAGGWPCSGRAVLSCPPVSSRELACFPYACQFPRRSPSASSTRCCCSCRTARATPSSQPCCASCLASWPVPAAPAPHAARPTRRQARWPRQRRALLQASIVFTGGKLSIAPGDKGSTRHIIILDSVHCPVAVMSSGMVADGFVAYAKTSTILYEQAAVLVSAPRTSSRTSL